MNALALRPGRSRFAACVRRFATRGCVRGSLARWARRGVLRCAGRPSHRFRWLVSPSIGRARACFCLCFSVPEARGHERINPHGVETRPRIRSARKRRTLNSAAERAGWRHTLPTSHAARRRTASSPPSSPQKRRRALSILRLLDSQPRSEGGLIGRLHQVGFRSVTASPRKAPCVVASSRCRALCPRVPHGCLGGGCSTPPLTRPAITD